MKRYLLKIFILCVNVLLGVAQTTTYTSVPAAGTSMSNVTCSPSGSMPGSGCSYDFLGGTIKMRVKSISGSSVTFEIQKCDGSSFSSSSSVYIKEGNTNALASLVCSSTNYSVSNSGGATLTKTIPMSHTSGTRHFVAVSVGATDRYYSWRCEVIANTTTSPPIATTGSASAQVTTATLNGTFNPNGTSTMAKFQYGTSSSNLNYEKECALGAYFGGTSTRSAQVEITGLSGNTTYYYRIVAVNQNGQTTNGQINNFTTDSPTVVPEVTISSATNITSTSATLQGTVNPRGYNTAYLFEYALNSSFSSSKATSPVTIGSGTMAQSVSQTITGLFPSNTYYFRVIAANTAGEVKSSHSSFTTSMVADAIRLYQEMIFPSTITIGQSASFSIKILNNQSADWTGNFYLKESSTTIYSWANQSISEYANITLNGNYTFTSTGTKTLTLYYRTSGTSSDVLVEPNGYSNPFSITINSTHPPSLSVSPLSYNFAVSGGISSTITITSTQSWTISDNADWLTISKANGSGNSTFTITAQTNTAPSLRTAKVTIVGGGIERVINITQDGTSNCSIEPLLTTKWNQGVPYNNLCPLYNDNISVTGCVATAMAQIMKFWEYPKTRTKTIPSYTTSELEIFVPDITDATTYDWANMKNTTNECNTNSTTQNAVATLMYECGVSVKMDYTPNSSGAFVGANIGPVAALPNYFNYDDRIDIKYRNNYDDNAWNALLREELDAGRPIFYCGYGSGGHAFVCDGYRNCSNENEFHFNWGWGGSADGYFVTSILNPGSIHNYSENQKIVINIKPLERDNFFDPSVDDENVFTITASGGSGGILIPNGISAVYPYTNKIYLFEPNEGYETDEVLIDGVTNATAKTNGYYIFSNITNNHTIVVTFKVSSSGIENPKSSQNISVFPNPAKKEIFIKNENAIGKVEIYKLTGALLKQENNFNEKISVSDLPQGIYLLKVHTDNGIKVSKIVKE